MCMQEKVLTILLQHFYKKTYQGHINLFVFLNSKKLEIQWLTERGHWFRKKECAAAGEGVHWSRGIVDSMEESLVPLIGGFGSI